MAREGYFEREQSVAAYGQAPERVIRLLADRYMRDNPPVPYTERLWDPDGIQTDSQGRYHFDFGRRFPEAENGAAVWAAGDLCCPAERSSRFIVTCAGPTQLWVNGEAVYRSEGNQERDEIPCTVPVFLKQGRNRFLLRSEKTAIGFGCTLQNAMPQWEPCHYLAPFGERQGEAGFLYTEPAICPEIPETALWQESEPATGLTWLPEPPEKAGDRITRRLFVEAPLFGRWSYPLGVTLYGLLEAGRQLGEKAYIDYVHSHVRQVTEIQEYALRDKAQWGFPGVNEQLCWLDALDDCGSFGSLMLECDPEGKDPAVRRIAERIGTYMAEEQPRTPEGAFRRRDETIWADDLYMSGPFLCRYAGMTGKRPPLDDCAGQQLKYRRLLYLPEKKIMAHMMCLRHGKNNGIPWSRGNGWVIFSLSELLARLPEDHPDHEALVNHFQDLTEGYLGLQDENGLWHQILDEKETYLETSATAMFICAFCRGARRGWYPEVLGERAVKAAERAWRGLTEQAIDREGNLYGVCRGSGFSFSRAYYRRLMWNRNDTHGIGIVMLAGVELMRTNHDR